MEDRFNDPHMSSFEIEVLGHKLFLSQDPNSRHLGTTVWDSSLVFAKYMERSSKKGEFSRARISGKRVIELGAGCGLAGIAMALLGCDVVVTDQVAVLPILLRNVERNLARARYTASDNVYQGSIGNVEVAELDWGNNAHAAALEPPFDYIIGTDVVYIEHLLEPLMSTILALAGPKTVVILGYEFRSSGVREQLDGLCKKHFHVKKVLHSKMDPKYQHPNIDLLILRRIDTSTSKTTYGSSEANCLQDEAGKSHEQQRGDGSNGCLSHCYNQEGVGWEQSPPAAQDETFGAEFDDELSSGEGESCPAESFKLDRNKITPSLQSGVDNSRQEMSRGRPSDWEIRRLGSEVARLMSEVSPPSA
jgi:predicted nicotinamide N-methyase